MREALKFVGGSVVVYVVMAACSSSYRVPHPEEFEGAMGGSGPMGNAGAPGVGGLANASGSGSMGLGGDNDPTGQMGTAGQVEGAGGSAGGSGPLDAGMMDAIADAMTDPVPDASAEESGSRLKARYYVGDDGSKQFAGWYDSERKENCTVMSASDGVLRCLPFTLFASAGSYFSDSNCSSQYFVAAKPTNTACGTTPSTGYGYTSTCGFTFYTLTPASPSVVYAGTPGACTEVTAPTTYAFFTGTSIPASSFVKMTDQVE
jgi:hypothetical protein